MQAFMAPLVSKYIKPLMSLFIGYYKLYNSSKKGAPPVVNKYRNFFFSFQEMIHMVLTRAVEYNCVGQTTKVSEMLRGPRVTEYNYTNTGSIKTVR